MCCKHFLYLKSIAQMPSIQNDLSGLEAQVNKFAIPISALPCPSSLLLKHVTYFLHTVTEIQKSQKDLSALTLRKSSSQATTHDTLTRPTAGSSTCASRASPGHMAAPSGTCSTWRPCSVMIQRTSPDARSTTGILIPKPPRNLKTGTNQRTKSGYIMSLQSS